METDWPQGVDQALIRQGMQLFHLEFWQNKCSSCKTQHLNLVELLSPTNWFSSQWICLFLLVLAHYVTTCSRNFSQCNWMVLYGVSYDVLHIWSWSVGTSAVVLQLQRSWTLHTNEIKRLHMLSQYLVTDARCRVYHWSATSFKRRRRIA